MLKIWFSILSSLGVFVHLSGLNTQNLSFLNSGFFENRQEFKDIENFNLHIQKSLKGFSNSEVSFFESMKRNASKNFKTQKKLLLDLFSASSHPSNAGMPKMMLYTLDPGNRTAHEQEAFLFEKFLEASEKMLQNVFLVNNTQTASLFELWLIVRKMLFANHYSYFLVGLHGPIKSIMSSTHVFLDANFAKEQRPDQLVQQICLEQTAFQYIAFLQIATAITPWDWSKDQAKISAFDVEFTLGEAEKIQRRFIQQKLSIKDIVTALLMKNTFIKLLQKYERLKHPVML